MKPDETPMFDPSLLKEVDWSQNTATFSPAISPTHPGEGLVLRPLCTADLNRGFFKVLGQLTETGVVSPEQFMKSFEHMKKSGDYYVTVVEDVTLGQIVATATLIIEHKFIHSCAKRGRVEDVVVSDECRGKQLGKLDSLCCPGWSAVAQSLLTTVLTSLGSELGFCHVVQTGVKPLGSSDHLPWLPRVLGLQVIINPYFAKQETELLQDYP
ncbi:glucosamine 6-phosphate N-acetyltransferase isoform X1 [Pongo pygmaeus]|uniref:glucosamine 6-phosphate N-acetyltransferase isoform X1 n=1 Tax=Pongo pygmaeus TaxID=9600 RepID=UPI0030053924